MPPMKTTMRRSKEAIVIAIGVAMHAILPILPMIAVYISQSETIEVVKKMKDEG